MNGIRLHWHILCLICLVCGQLLPNATGQTKDLQLETPVEPAQGLKADTKPNFETLGPQVGDQVPNLSLLTQTGELQHLADAWRNAPALIITSSLTCPKSRSRWPEVKAIVEKYGEKINVVILYVIEAHPVGSVCPYKSVEDITAENERDGLLRKQPATLKERLALAQEFKRYLKIDLPIYIDNEQNQAWKALGAAPNLGLLVNKQGIVEARLGWFTGEGMQQQLNVLLAKHKAAELVKEVEHNLQRFLDSRESPFNDLAYELQNAILEKKQPVIERIVQLHPLLLKAVFRADQGHRYSATPLMEAIIEKNLPAAKFMLEHGADVNASTYTYASVVETAVEHGNLEMLSLILQHKADVHIPGTGQLLVRKAAFNQNMPIVKQLIAAGLKHDFYCDLATGNLAAVQTAVLNDPSLVFRPDGHSRYPLDYAVKHQNNELAKWLLDHNAPVVKEKHVQHDPPLHLAIRNHDLAMVTMLLAAGSSPDTKVGHFGDSPQWTPALHLAITEKQPEIVKLLIQYKVDLTARDTYSMTALHQVASNGEVAMLKLLLQAGADPNAQQLGF